MPTSTISSTSREAFREIKQTVRSPLGVAALIVTLYLGLVIAALHFALGWNVREGAAVAGWVLASFGGFTAVVSFRHWHEWNRRHSTVELLKTWNTAARPHLARLTVAFPDYFNVPKTEDGDKAWKNWKMPEERAKQIFEARDTNDPDDGTSDVQLRESVLELLNYFEHIVCACNLRVVDVDTIKTCFGTVMLDTWKHFFPIVEQIRNANRRDPWPPLTTVMAEWQLEHLREESEKTYRQRTKEEEEAMSKSEAKPKTGN